MENTECVWGVIMKRHEYTESAQLASRVVPMKSATYPGTMRVPTFVTPET